MILPDSTYKLITDLNYYNRSEVSNSDLSTLQKYWEPEHIIYDKEKAYKFGSLIDAMITEPERVNYFRFTVDKVQYTKEDFELAKKMKASFNAHPLAALYLKQANTQAIMIRNLAINYDGVDFVLPARCKWDLWLQGMKRGGDIKSTTAETQAQFAAACKHFDYDRQRAWYMDIAGSDTDILFGISKKNHKVFQLPIVRGDEFYNSGKEKYQAIAFKHWYLFGELKAA